MMSKKRKNNYKCKILNAYMAVSNFGITKIKVQKYENLSKLKKITNLMAIVDSFIEL